MCRRIIRRRRRRTRRSVAVAQEGQWKPTEIHPGTKCNLFLALIYFFSSSVRQKHCLVLRLCTCYMLKCPNRVCVCVCVCGRVHGCVCAFLFFVGFFPLPSRALVLYMLQAVGGLTGFNRLTVKLVPPQSAKRDLHLDQSLLSHTHTQTHTEDEG